MLTRCSLAAAIISVSLSGAMTSADWITPEEQRNQSSASAVTKVSETGETADDVFDNEFIKPVVAEEVVATNVESDSAEPLDSEIAADVERLLRQDENWLAPIVVESTEAEVATVAHSDAPVSESLSFLGDLEQLDDSPQPWVAESDAVEEYDPTFGLENEFPAEITEQYASLTEPKFVVETPAYMNDLESLVFGRSGDATIRNASTQYYAQAEGSSYSPAVPPPAEDFEEHSSNLFAPMSALSVTGKSSTGLKKNADSSKHPESRAMAYVNELIPAKYVGRPMLTVSRPNRYPHVFLHNTLYFEDPNLERCGKGRGYLTNAKSTALFAGQVAALPITMCQTPPRTCMPTLGDCPTCHSFGWDAYFREWRNHR